MAIIGTLRSFFLFTALLLRLSLAQAQNEDIVTTQQYKDWAVHCGSTPNKDPKQKEQCIMTQLAGKDDKPVAQTSFAYEPEKKYVIAEFTVPLGSVLPAGLRLKVDDGKESQLPFQFCIPIGCRIVLPVKQEFIDSMKQGTILHMSFNLINGQTANVRISLQGFSAALNAISK